MRRISTLFFGSVFLMLISSLTYGQTQLTCSAGSNGNCFGNTPANQPTYTQNFNSPTIPTGYVATSYNVGASNSAGEYFLQTTNYQTAAPILTPYFTFGQPSITLSFDGSATGGPNPSTVTIGYTTQSQTSLSSLTTCTANLTVNGSTCINLSNLPVNTPIRLWISFANPNGAGSSKFTFDNLQLNFTTSVAALPVNFVNFRANKANNGMQLTWDVANEEQLNHYEIERGTDGRNFTSIGTVSASGKSTYTFTDPNLSSGATFYRIKSVDNDGRYKYSTVLKLDNGKASIVLKVFPLPAVNNITIQHGVAAQGASITISSGDGKAVRTIVPSLSSMQTPVDVSGLRAGMYLVRYDDGSGNVETTKIIKQ